MVEKNKRRRELKFMGREKFSETDLECLSWIVCQEKLLLQKTVEIPERANEWCDEPPPRPNPNLESIDSKREGMQMRASSRIRTCRRIIQMLLNVRIALTVNSRG
ncbi:hypothetical protein AVEN_62035-1 [Araneus ventricosus]|uniref:Uncharacterized protein n=1 Tax=Araneus ventricosus TaxID=182803 RepID=A0A4Y2LGZ5_ARAVE|nr:hypothetical protein AVEN_62035-1 [Araneus ventricosus]